jgi:hypothetical protein
MSDSAAAQDRPLRELRGVVERITFQNAENGFTVARLAPERPEAEAEAARGEDRLVTVVGTLADPTPGEAVVARAGGGLMPSMAGSSRRPTTARRCRPRCRA